MASPDPSLIDLGLKWFGAFSAVGLFFAGAWKGYKSRVYAPRLELSISSELLRWEDNLYLRVVVGAKNIGAARAVIKRQLSHIRVCYMEQEDPTYPVVTPIHMITVEVLPSMFALESGESASDTIIIVLPHDLYLALHIELGMTTAGLTSNTDGRDWRKVEVLNCKLQPNN